MVDFDIGDYVLLHRSGIGPKLQSKWTGPYRVKDYLTEYIYVLEDLQESKTTVAHLSRILKYRADLDEAKALHISQYQYYAEGNEVKAIKGMTFDTVTGEYTFEIEWLGCELTSHEPALRIIEDIGPNAVQLEEFFRANRNNPDANRLYRQVYGR